MTSHHDIIARLERSPAAWVCIRREAADEIRKLRAENADLRLTIRKLREERDQWMLTAVDLDQQSQECQDRDSWRTKAEALQAEVERMKPMVEAAVIWERHFSRLAMLRLIEALRTYQQTTKKTAAEAVANVADMMGPVKNCTTCRFSCSREVTIACASNDRIEWEPRHD